MDEFFFSYPLEDNIASASSILRNLTLYRTQKSTVIVSVLSEITKYDQSFSIYQLGKGLLAFHIQIGPETNLSPGPGLLGHVVLGRAVMGRLGPLRWPLKFSDQNA